ncbi:hypothetical protein LTS18_010051, partial [Coniosporium uncinatum]
MAYNTSPANTTTQPTTAATAATTTKNIRGSAITSEGNTQSTTVRPRLKRKQADDVSRQRRLRRRGHLLRELPDPNISQQAPEERMAWPSQRSRSTRLYQHIEAYANTLPLDGYYRCYPDTLTEHRAQNRGWEQHRRHQPRVFLRRRWDNTGYLSISMLPDRLRTMTKYQNLRYGESRAEAFVI